MNIEGPKVFEVPFYDLSKPARELNMFKPNDDINIYEGNHIQKQGLDQFLKHEEEVEIPQETISEDLSKASQSERIKYQDSYETQSITSKTSQSEYESAHDHMAQNVNLQSDFNGVPQSKVLHDDIIPNNFMYNQDQTIHSSETESNREVVYSQQNLSQQQIQPNINKYNQFLPISERIDDEETSQYSQEFLKNGGNNDPSNGTNSEISEDSSFISKSEEDKSDSYSSNTSPMNSSVKNRSPKKQPNATKNELMFSYSDTDEDDEHESFQNDFITSSKLEFDAPKMQVFNYQPMFKNQESAKQPAINIRNTSQNSDTIHDPSRFSKINGQEENTNLITFEFKNTKSIADGYREKLYGKTEKENVSNNAQFDSATDKPDKKLYAGGRTKEQILAQRKGKI